MYRDEEDVPMVEEVKEAFEFASRDVWQLDGHVVRLAHARTRERALEEVPEEGRIAFHEVPVHAEQAVLHLMPVS